MTKLFDKEGEEVGKVDKYGRVELATFTIPEYEPDYYDFDSSYDMKAYMDNMDIHRSDVINIETIQTEQYSEYSESKRIVKTTRLWYWEEKL